jgi:hypothetical protein
MRKLSWMLLALALVLPATLTAEEGCAGSLSSDDSFLTSLGAADAGLALASLSTEPKATRALCTATANCGSSSPVSCSGNSTSTSCVAVDQNCLTGQRGYVTCDGVTTQCPACPNCGPATRYWANWVDCCNYRQRLDYAYEISCTTGQRTLVGTRCVTVASCTPR